MIRRELPLTKSRESGQGLSHREERGFSFVLAPAAADHALELNCLVQGFCFSLIGKFFVFNLSYGNGLSASLLGPNGDRPDKAQQLPSDRGDDFPLILACHSQLPVTLVQAILRLPCDLDDVRWNAFMALTQLLPNARQVSIAPG